jgi:Rrf2 family protein
MITIPKKVEYSMMLISFLAKNEGKTVSLAEVSKKLFLPYRFLGQLCVDLKLGEIIESREGRSGGYVLAKNWQEKTIYDLIVALGENKRLVKCLGGDVGCAQAGKCEIRGLWSKIESVLVDELKKIKLSNI